MGVADWLKEVDSWGMSSRVIIYPGPFVLPTCFSAEENNFLLPHYRPKRNPGSNHSPTEIISQKYLLSLKPSFNIHTLTHVHTYSHPHSHMYTHIHTPHSHMYIHIYTHRKTH